MQIINLNGLKPQVKIASLSSRAGNEMFDILGQWPKNSWHNEWQDIICKSIIET